MNRMVQGNYMRIALWLALGWLCVVFGAANAEEVPGAELRVLQAINYQASAGDAVLVTLQLSQEAPEPTIFTVEKPARLSIDLPGTGLALSKRYEEINLGNVKAYAAAEGTNRTRVVIELDELGAYNVQQNGNSVTIEFAASENVASVEEMTLDPTETYVPLEEPATTAIEVAVEEVDVLEPQAAQGLATISEPSMASVVEEEEVEMDESIQIAPVVAIESEASLVAAPVLAAPVIVDTGITNIDFRRGEQGEGRVIISLSDPAAEVEVSQKGGDIVASFDDIKVRDDLIQRLDVLDFATPIKYVDTERSRKGTTITIVPVDKAYFEESSYLSGNDFIIDLRPLTRAEEEDLEERTFRGERISLNFQSIDIRAALRIIADVAAVNLVVSDKVQGEMALRLDDVPWDQALDIILTTNGLGKRLEGNVLLIAPIKELAALEKAEFQAIKSRQTLEPLISEILRVNFAKASEMAQLLEETRESGGDEDNGNNRDGLLSKRGSVTVDERTNTMLITDTREHMREIRRVIEILDVPIEQVLVESRIVVATDDFSKELGARFGVSALKATNGHFVTTNGSSEGNDAQVNDFVNNGLPVPLPGIDDRFNVNLPAAGQAGRIGLAILGADYLVDLELSAMQAEGEGEIISTPRVLTANAREALVKQGFEVPYVSTSQNGTNVQFKDAVLELKVTPQITPDDRIIMDLNIKKDEPDFANSIQGNPPLRKREITTQVLVNNGETVVLGGVYEQAISESITKVPVLGDIPLFGRLFRNNLNNDSKNELLIFVTPKILKEGLRLD